MIETLSDTTGVEGLLRLPPWTIDGLLFGFLLSITNECSNVH